MEVGSRPEEIEAERSKLRRLQEEIRHLEEQRRKQSISASVPGLITTPRVREKVGQYLREGDLICAVEEPAGLEVEIALAEQDVARVQPGQSVHLKARALPFETFVSRVERIAPAAGRGDVQSSVTVYCLLDPTATDLRPEMTGHARIYTGKRRIGAILLDRALRYVRTEFWW
jgi:multidrug resistance efflux pump